uniref:Uncharacterized protein n=1 Tax=Canis lupus familiaris TaxID=9615 RepID=A0A8C0MZ53_CANLF
ISTSSDSFEQSFPAAALSNCKIMFFSSARVSGTNTCKFSKQNIPITPSLIFTLTYCFDFRTSRRSLMGAESMNSADCELTFLNILANPSALEALSLASRREGVRLHLISSEALESSALVQNSAQLSCKPNSKKLPVDFSSIPAMSLENKNRNRFGACLWPRA